MIEQQPNSARGFEILVHGDPDLQRELERRRKNRQQLRRSPGEIRLTPRLSRGPLSAPRIEPDRYRIENRISRA
jgi:hypothetical protein